ncbi:MAG: CRISPR-associated endonuclease Cas1 [Myxococcota bacterium]
MQLRPELARAALIRSLILASVALLWASAAGAYDPDASIHGNYRGQCRRLTKQIEYYDKQIRPLAIARRDRAWEAATDAQLLRLWNKRADLCPEYGKERARILRAIDRIRAFNRMLARAGRAAAQYFTGGAMP